MRLLRNFSALWLRITNLYSKIVNRFRFACLGIEYGRNLCVHGHVGLTLSPAAKVSIGDNFYMSNGRHINPLSGNSEGHIHVEDGAELKIGNHVAISSTRIWCAKHVEIKDFALIGGNVTITDTDAHSMNWVDRKEPIKDKQNKCDRPVVIGRNTFIGMNTIILKGVNIGDRAIIGAGSVVTQNIPADCVAAGNPAKIIIGKRYNGKIRNK